MDAYDFSPIQIASYLSMWSGVPSDKDIEILLNQLADLKTKYEDAKEITVEEMNHIFDEAGLSIFIEEITANIHVARDLIARSEALRWRPAAPPEAN
jgi:hypothetical protein